MAVVNATASPKLSLADCLQQQELVNYLNGTINDSTASSSPSGQAQYWLENVDERVETSCWALLERFAAVTIYFATNGGNWSNSHDFLTANTSICEWNDDKDISTNGIVCSDNHVVGIKLIENRLMGTIPSEIAFFQSLYSLYVHNWRPFSFIPSSVDTTQEHNELHGPIPSEIGTLVNLTYLYMYNNILTGELPTTIGKLTNLRSLRFGDNAIRGDVPPEFSLLSNLKVLGAGNCQLSGRLSKDSIPGNVENLALDNNYLTGPLPELGQCLSLERIELHNNSFSGSLSTLLGNLSNLRTLSLGYNELTGSVPNEIERLSELKILSLGNNSITGTIPIGLSQLSELEFLDLWGNQFQGSIESNGSNSFPKLESAYLHDNLFTGDLSPTFCTNRMQAYETFWADCLRPFPEVGCTCCTLCCNNTERCETNANYYSGCDASSPFLMVCSIPLLLSLLHGLFF